MLLCEEARASPPASLSVSVKSWRFFASLAIPGFQRALDGFALAKRDGVSNCGYGICVDGQTEKR
jgi:hypothetical protein